MNGDDCRSTGLAEPFRATGKGKVRPMAKKMPIRKGEIWGWVEVIYNEKAYTTAPDLSCRGCGKKFSGGVTRVKHHIVRQCSSDSEALKELQKKLLQEEEKKREVDTHKRVCNEMDAAAAGDFVDPEEELEAPERINRAAPVQPGTTTGPKAKQRDIANMMAGVGSELMDNRIADLIYGEGLPFSIVESPQFLELIEAAKCAPSSYKPPNRKRLAGNMRTLRQPIESQCNPFMHAC